MDPTRKAVLKTATESGRTHYKNPAAEVRELWRPDDLRSRNSGDGRAVQMRRWLTAVLSPGDTYRSGRRAEDWAWPQKLQRRGISKSFAQSQEQKCPK